ncbi:MAG: GH92 family glycosyl hydrolase [Sandaracinaceae bacterium]
MRTSPRTALVLLALLAVGCPGPTVSDAGRDAGASDAGPPPPPPESRAAEAPFIDYVDPMIGTGGQGFNDIGSAYPGPARPFAMIHPGPDTAAEAGGALTFLHCAGFASSDPYVTGFSHMRMHGTGIADYGHLSMMPIGAMDPSFTDQAGSRDRIVEGSAESRPGYYSVSLERGRVDVELTSTDRVASHRYTFEAGASQGVLIDLAHRMSDDIVSVGGQLEIDPSAREVRGDTRVRGGYSGRFGGVRIYFVMRFDRDFASYGTFTDGVTMDGATTASGAAAGAWLSFDPAGSSVVRAEVAVSMVDVDGALANLDAESTGFDFDRMRSESEAAWEAELSRIRIAARYDHDLTRFYTALYHALLMPTLGSDVDGRYRGLDDAIHTADGYRYHTDFSMWDTYRTLHPFLTLAYPERQRDLARSLVAMCADGGAMPRWPLGTGYTGGMLGDPGAIILADSWVKGVRDFDLAAAYDALYRGAFGAASSTFDGRGVADVYDRMGYVPIESSGSAAARTLEFAYADYAMAVLADAVGHADEAARFRERAGSWRNTYDPTRGFFVGRHEDGSYAADFREETWQDYYAEGNARQYLWLVPYDPDGLMEVLGGREAALERLDAFFTESRRERRGALPPAWYWHGNEPDLHAPFLFNAMGSPERAATWSRWVAQTMYGDGPDGLPGNDDAGTMSAWLLFATMGIYPIAGQDHYLLGSPLATHVELDVEGGTFVIDAPDASDAMPIVANATVGGDALPALQLAHSRIVAGATLSLEMR